MRREGNGNRETRNPSASRRRLHIFYLLNDLLHHAKYHSQQASVFATFSQALQPFLVDIVEHTASDCRPRVRSRLSQLFSFWREEEYYPADFVAELRAALDPTQSTGISKAASAGAKAPELAKYGKELPFVMPSTHGDPSIPYFDLPAGNLMPHIMANSSAPIRPDEVRALQFAPGPADDSLVHALKDFLREVDEIDDSVQRDTSAAVTDIDELGQISYQDENGDIVGGDTYYGWSRAFCEKMKRRREGGDRRDTRARSYTSSRSPSRSLSRSPRKRRRYSDSTSSRSASRSRSPQSRNTRPNESSTWRTSRDDMKPSRSRSYSPRQSFPVPEPPLHPTHSQPGRGFSTQFPQTAVQNITPTFPMVSPEVPFPTPLGPGRLPFPPPPPPPNYSGPWPTNVNFPPGLPFPATPIHPGSTIPPRSGPPGRGQSWNPTNWHRKS